MKFKSLFSGIIFAVGMSVVVGTCINNPQADTYGDWVWEKNYRGNTITGYIGNETDVTIPHKLGSITIDSVKIWDGSDATNENLKNVKKVTFDSGYTVMINTTIKGFENVEELVIPEGVTETENLAFDGLKNLKKVQFPSTLKKIGNNAFNGCISLESINLPEGLETIEWGAFSGCTGLKSVTLPDSLKEMGYDVFQGCTGLKDENGLIIVRGHLYHMDIPSGVTEVTIPDGVKVLDGELFSRNLTIKKVTIPEGVTKIEHRIFNMCSNLEEVYVPDSVTYIGSYSFDSCSSLKKLRVPSEFERGSDPFRGCKALQDDKGFVVVGGILCDYFGTAGKVVIPEGVKEIEHNCFSNEKMTELVLPNSLVSIGQGAFQNCSKLTKVEIPDSVTSIGRGAFSGCSSVSELKLSGNVKKLDSSVFSGTTNLKKVVVPEGVEEIEFFAFSDSGIEELTLPTSLKKLRLNGLKDGVKVIFNGTPEEWEKLNPDPKELEKIDLVILKVTPTPTSVNTVTPTPLPATATPTAEVTTVPESSPAVTATPTAEAAPVAESTAVVTPTPAPETTVSVTPAVDTFKLKGNSYKIKGKNVTLTKGAKKAKVVIPATVKFNGKKYKVTAIGTSAFKSNKKLKSVTIGKNVKVIGKKAFYGDSKLSSVTIKSKLLKASKVGKNAFKGVNKTVVFKVPAAKKKLYSKIIAKSVKSYKIK